MIINGIREKVIHCGPYAVKTRFLEIDIFPFWETKKRAKKEKRYETESKQRDLNDKNSRRTFNQMVKANFTEKDMILGLSFAPKFQPKTYEETKKEFENYIKRVNRLRKKKGLKNAKYIAVIEVTSKGKHHIHLFIEDGLDRDEIENLWRRPRKKGEKVGEKIGRANSQRIQPDKNFCEALTNYLMKDPKGKHRWIPSRNNLHRPWITKSDCKYKRSTIDKLVKMPPDSEYVKNFFEKKHEGYELTECKPVFNKELGRWSIYLKMRLRS